MADSNPKILILLSTYNGEKYLQQQLTSLRLQIGVDVYYLIRDDGSKDATIEILNHFSSMESNVELIFGNNIGFAYSFRELLILGNKYLDTVNYFAFCDQDDIWLKDKLYLATVQLKKMSSSIPGMYCSNLLLIDENLNSLGKAYQRGTVRFSKGNSLVESISTGCTMVFNRKTIETFNNYLPQNITFHDFFIYQMCIFFGEVYYDDVPHILYRQHRDNVIGGKKNTIIARWKHRFKLFSTLSSQHYREWAAQELLRLYEGILSDEDKRLIRIVANYKQSLLARIRFLFPPKGSNLKMSTLSSGMRLKIRILLGAV